MSKRMRIRLGASVARFAVATRTYVEGNARFVLVEGTPWELAILMSHIRRAATFSENTPEQRAAWHIQADVLHRHLTMHFSFQLMALPHSSDERKVLDPEQAQ